MSEHSSTAQALIGKIRKAVTTHHPAPGLRKFLDELNFRFNLTSLLWVNPGAADGIGLLLKAHSNNGTECDSGRISFSDSFVFASSADRRAQVLVVNDPASLINDTMAEFIPGGVSSYRRALVLRQGLGQGSAGIVCLLHAGQVGQTAALSQTLSEIKPAFESIFSTFGIVEALCSMPLPWSDTGLAGRVVVPGKACGRAVYLNRFTDLDDQQIDSCTAPDVEHQRLQMALERLESIFSQAVRQEDAPLDEVGFIYELFLHVLSDNSFRDELHKLIDSGYTARSAAVLLARRYQSSFNQIGDEYLRERRHDFIYLAQRLIGTLEDHEWQRPQEFGDDKIVLAGDEIGVPDIMMIPAGKLVALVAHRGSTLAHVTILARAKSIPVVTGISPFHLMHMNNRTVVVDAGKGRLVVEPCSHTRHVLSGPASADRRAALSAGPAGVVCSADGVPISCYANLGLVEEADAATREQVSGVGLFRSEIYFHSQMSFPSLQSQTQYYRRLLLAFHPRPVWMRLLDVGRDKTLHYFSTEYAKRDWCGARMLIDNPDIMRTQIEAMMRASVNLGNLRLLVPNVTQIEEIIIIRRAVDDIYDNLRVSMPGLVRPEFGAMVEIPGLIFLIDHLARHVDYISVGSNDLLRNLLLADRENQLSMDYHSFLSPAVLRALSTIIKAADASGLRVSICGEALTGTRELMMCLGAGLRTLSVGAASVSRARLRIAGLRVARAQILFARALEMDTTAAVQELLENENSADTIRLA